jgi:hypothetical protein
VIRFRKGAELTPNDAAVRGEIDQWSAFLARTP